MADLWGDEEAAVGLRWRVPFVAAAVVSLVLGYWGLLRYAEASPDYGTGVDDLVYWDLQLFVLGAEPAQDGGDIPWMLQVARFLAPLATLSALLLAARALFSSQLMRLRAQRSRHHTVVIGTEAPAAVLTRELLHAGDRVVVVTSGRGAGRPPAGALVVAGDPRADDVLRRAATPRAATSWPSPPTASSTPRWRWPSGRWPSGREPWSAATQRSPTDGWAQRWWRPRGPGRWATRPRSRSSAATTAPSETSSTLAPTWRRLGRRAEAGGHRLASHARTRR